MSRLVCKRKRVHFCMAQTKATFVFYMQTCICMYTTPSTQRAHTHTLYFLIIKRTTTAKTKLEECIIEKEKLHTKKNEHFVFITHTQKQLCRRQKQKLHDEYKRQDESMCTHMDLRDE